jgi:hypothetical protein
VGDAKCYLKNESRVAESRRWRILHSTGKQRIVDRKDLGEKTEDIVTAMTEYCPDGTLMKSSRRS